jgi:hypothetical protein
VTAPQPASPTTLTGSSLREVRGADLAEEVAEVLAQVERPRVNLGGSAPPGRAD